MARPALRYTLLVKDVNSLTFVCENARVWVTREAVVDPLWDGTGPPANPPPVMWDEPVGGNPVVNPLVTNTQGEVLAFLDEMEAPLVDLYVDDNNGTAHRADLATLASFPPFVEEDLELALQGGHVIAFNGVPLPAEAVLNFVGACVTVTDDPLTGQTVVTISCSPAASDEVEWVAVGNSGTSIATSPDGVAWTARPSPFQANGGYGVAWNGSLWVAVGQGSPGIPVIITSPDGVVWTAQTSPLDTGNGLGVAWNGTIWVAVGQNTGGVFSVVVSPDGMSWTPSSSPFDQPTGFGGNGVAWNGTIWVAVGSTGVGGIAISPDGVAWTAQPSPFGAGRGNGVAWNGSLWVAVGSDVAATVAVLTSPDGITWTAQVSPFDGGAGYGVAWNGTIWVAVGLGLGGVAVIATSPDGTTWTAQSSPFDGGTVVSGAAWNGTLWVAVGQGPGGVTTTATSSDGLTWTAQTSPLDGGEAIGVASKTAPNLYPPR